MKRLITCLLVAGVLPCGAEVYAGVQPAPAYCHYGTDSLSVGRVNPIENIVVDGNHTVAEPLSPTVSTVGRAQIAGAHAPSLLPTLSEQVPGLFATARGVMGYGVAGGAAGQISIRGIGGAPTTGVTVLVDGHPQYMGIMGHPIADACLPMMAERVEVVKGPASVLYGSGAMGGVVNITTRRPDKDGLTGEASAGYGSYNSVQGEAVAQFYSRGLSVSAGISYNRTDGHRKNMDFSQLGAFCGVKYAISRAWSVRADMNMTGFDASQAGSVTSPLEDADQRVLRWSVSAAVSNGYEKASGSFSVFYNRGRHLVGDGHAPTAPPLDYRFRSRDNTLGVSLRESFRPFRGNTISVGAEWTMYGGSKWNERISGQRFAELDRTMHDIAGYLTVSQRFLRWLSAEAGLRIDHNTLTGTEYIPQAGIRFGPGKGLNVRLSASKGFRSPTIRELYMVPQRNEGLQAERLWSYEVAFAGKAFKERISWGLNIFLIDSDNMIVVVPREGSAPQFANSGAVRNFGIEAEVGWRISPSWRTDANYTFLNMKRPVIATPKHKLYAGVSFSRGRWSASTGVQYIKELYTSAGTTPATDSFVLWNVRGELRATKWLYIWIRGENLLAQRYEIIAGYPMPRATLFGGVRMRW